LIVQQLEERRLWQVDGLELMQPVQLCRNPTLDVEVELAAEDRRRIDRSAGPDAHGDR